MTSEPHPFSHSIAWRGAAQPFFSKNTDLPTCFQIASCTRSAIYSTLWCSTETGLHLDFDFEASSLAKKPAIFPLFSSSDDFDRTPMNYYRAYSKNHCVHNLLALWLSAWMCWQWVGPKLHSLLSAPRLIGACFLTTKSDKRMRLLTRIYSNILQLQHHEIILTCNISQLIKIIMSYFTSALQHDYSYWNLIGSIMDCLMVFTTFQAHLLPSCVA